MSKFNTETFWTQEAKEHMSIAKATFRGLRGDFETMLNICHTSIENGGKILFFGNGGSAADAQHLATELAVRYVHDRIPIPAIALTTDTSALTACGNDMGFDRIFARQVEALSQPGDVAIGISTSGNSVNVLEALRISKMRRLKTIGFTGETGGEMGPVCDCLLKIPSNTTARIQEMHITIGQMLCGALEKKLNLV